VQLCLGAVMCVGRGGDACNVYGVNVSRQT